MIRVFAVVALASLIALAPARPAVSAVTGTVRGTIVLERGRLPVPLARAVTVTATDLAGNPVGRVRYRPVPGALRYEIVDLPLGGTLLVELALRQELAETELSRTGAAVPTLARSDRSSPIYAFVLDRSAPRKAPLDFRVDVTREASPVAVSFTR